MTGSNKNETVAKEESYSDKRYNYCSSKTHRKITGICLLSLDCYRVCGQDFTKAIETIVWSRGAKTLFTEMMYFWCISNFHLSRSMYSNCSILMTEQGWKKPRFFRKSFRFLRFQCTNKTGLKISTQEEHPIHNSLYFRAFL